MMRRNVTTAPIAADQKQRFLAKKRLDFEIKEIHINIHQQRMDIYRDFEANKAHYVEAARKNHSTSPERDAYEHYKQLDQEILVQRKHFLRQAYEKHGFNYEMENHALTRKFNVGR